MKTRDEIFIGFFLRLLISATALWTMSLPALDAGQFPVAILDFGSYYRTFDKHLLLAIPCLAAVRMRYVHDT